MFAVGRYGLNIALWCAYLQEPAKDAESTNVNDYKFTYFTQRYAVSKR
tara:strand:- start:2257 stop:2400 length:144 start_codon:yes stop_codon:yes gene_type:complete